MKKLVTDRLILRQWRKTDAQAMYDYAKNPKVGPKAGWKPHSSILETEQIIDMFIENDDAWAIVLKDGGKLLGSVGIHKGDKSRPNINSVYTLGYVLAEECWGNGYTYEACREVIRYVFEELEAEMLVVHHFVFNKQSQRVIEKCGFTREGVRRKAFKRSYDSKVFDQVCYSMIPAEFSVNRKVNHSEEADREEKFNAVKMSTENAYVCCEWRYPAPMDIYNSTPQSYQKNVQNIIDRTNGNEYFAVYNSLSEFFGIYAYRFTEVEILELEFRVEPEKMGRGFTKSFVNEAIRFGRENYHYSGDVIVKIPLANSRGIHLMKRRGASEIAVVNEQCNNTSYADFMYLKLQGK